MLREFAWKTFEYTGSIESYIFLKEIERNKKVLKEETKKARDEAAPSNA